MEKRKLRYSNISTGWRVKFNCQTTKIDFRGHKMTKSLKRGFLDKILTRQPILTIDSTFYSGIQQLSKPH
jgi:hypothetical protein